MLLGGWLLIRGWRQARTSGTLVCHNAAEKGTLTMAESGGWCLRGTSMLRRAWQMCLHGRTTAKFELVSQHTYLCLVILLQLQLVLFKLIDLVPDQFHLLYLLRNLGLCLLRASGLALELGSQGVKDIVQPLKALGRLARPQVRLANRAAMLSVGKHAAVYRDVGCCER